VLWRKRRNGITDQGQRLESNFDEDGVARLECTPKVLPWVIGIERRRYIQVQFERIRPGRGRRPTNTTQHFKICFPSDHEHMPRRLKNLMKRLQPHSSQLCPRAISYSTDGVSGMTWCASTSSMRRWTFACRSQPRSGWAKEQRRDG